MHFSEYVGVIPFIPKPHSIKLTYDFTCSVLYKDGIIGILRGTIFHRAGLSSALSNIKYTQCPKSSWQPKHPSHFQLSPVVRSDAVRTDGY